MDSRVMVDVNEEEVVEIGYRNWRGETAQTKIIPEHIFFGSVEWNLEDQWILTAYDLQRDGYSQFPLKDVFSWKANTLE